MVAVEEEEPSHDAAALARKLVRAERRRRNEEKRALKLAKTATGVSAAIESVAEEVSLSVCNIGRSYKLIEIIRRTDRGAHLKYETTAS